jgi:hypothetical protein
VLGLAPNAVLRRHVKALEKTTAERFTAAPAHGKVRRFAQFHDAARSWRRVERIIARVEAGAQGTDTRFIVTILEGGRPKSDYERLYCACGQAESHIKRRGRTISPTTAPSCHEATANQFRLFLHAGSYWLPLVDAPADAQRLGLACHAVPHSAAAPHQDRRLCRRTEKANQNPPAVEHPFNPKQAVEEVTGGGR